ncbi:MAG: hypothetical protein QM756_45265 [Polyangiaceae bacterium]
MATSTPAPEVKAAEAPVVEATPLLGLALGAPETGAMPGRFKPSYGEKPRSPNDWRFDFHGYLQVPARIGINSRAHALSTQHTTVFHGPPLVPDDYERFEHTGLIPQPYVQLGFSYGNSRVVANVVIAARNVSNGQGFFNPPSQLGINDAFLTFKPKTQGFNFEIDVGGFANRYGAMGEYDTGRYDTNSIARVGGVGETMRFRVPLSSELTFLAEHGLSGQWDRAPLGVEPAGWNGFTDSNVGTSFAHHAHLGIASKKLGRAGLHYVSAWTADDRTAPTQPDGSITVLGLDANAKLAPFGRLFVSGSLVNADKSRGVAPVLRVLNTAGGPGLMREYLGPNSQGTGKLTTAALQYDVSIGEILRGSAMYSGYAPDVFVSAFGLFTHVASDDSDYDDVDKLKYGAELGYSALPWLAFSGRYDRVLARMGDATKTFAAISPRVILAHGLQQPGPSDDWLHSLVLRLQRGRAKRLRSVRAVATRLQAQQCLRRPLDCAGRRHALHHGQHVVVTMMRSRALLIGAAAALSFACGGEDKGRPSPDVAVYQPVDQCALAEQYELQPIVDFERKGTSSFATCDPAIACDQPTGSPSPFDFNYDREHTYPLPTDIVADCVSTEPFFANLDQRDVSGTKIPDGPRCGGSSLQALRLTATNVGLCFGENGRLGWGAGLDLMFDKSKDFDASAWDGVSFWVKRASAISDAAFIFSVVDAQNAGQDLTLSQQEEAPGCGCLKPDSGRRGMGVQHRSGQDVHQSQDRGRREV